MDAVLKLDYCTINFDAGSIDLNKINDELLPNADLCFVDKGLSGNVKVSPFGLHYMNDSGYAPWPHRLQISGVGCSHFQNVIPFVLESYPVHISRTDFAFDILVSRDQWKSFLCTAFQESLGSTRLYKKYVLSGSGEAMTVYLGSRKCAKFCRIYNKTLEDKEYTILHNEVQYKPVPDSKGIYSEYIIRYELELKRFKGRGELFDPRPYLDSYFGDSQLLIDFIKNTWDSYGEDFLLPCNLNDLNLTVNYDKEKFCSKEVVDLAINDQLHDAPQSYSSTVAYIVDKFGKYIPFIIANPFYRNICIDKCEKYSGFRIEIIIPETEQGFYDLNDISENDLPFSDCSEYTQLQIQQKGGVSLDHSVYWSD